MDMNSPNDKNLNEKKPDNKKIGRQPLGRGLSALLGEVATEVPISLDQPTSPALTTSAITNKTEHKDFSPNQTNSSTNIWSDHLGAKKYREVLVAQITPNPFQPRKNFDPAKLQELAESLKQRGLIQPLLVRPHPKKPDHYELVAGERRWRAAQMAGLHQIPVLLKSLDNATSLELALLENLHRDDLNAMEEAEAFDRLITQFKHSHESLADLLGRSRPALTNALRLLQLPLAVQELIRLNKLSAAHGRVLAGLDNQNRSENLALRAVAEHWSVRQLENNIKKRDGELSDSEALGHKVGMAKTSGLKDNNILDIEQRLSRMLGLKAVLKVKKQGDDYKGQLLLNFASLDQLTKLFSKLTKK